jgi:hypothetical protein
MVSASLTLNPGTLDLTLKPIVSNVTNPFKVHYDSNNGLAALSVAVKTGKNRNGTCGACGIAAGIDITNLIPNSSLPPVLDVHASTDGGTPKKTTVVVSQESQGGGLKNDARIGSLTARVAVAPTAGGTAVGATPKIQAELREIPTTVTVSMLEGVLKGDGGKCKTERRLPSLSYTGGGLHKAGLDMDGKVDLTVLNDIHNLTAPSGQERSGAQPTITVGADDMSETMTFQEKPGPGFEGFEITNGDPIMNPPPPHLQKSRLGRLHLGISNLTLHVLNATFDTDACSAPQGIFRLRGGLSVKLKDFGIGITMYNVRYARIAPGLFSTAYGDFSNLDIGVRDLKIDYELGIGLSLVASIAGRQFEIPLVGLGVRSLFDAPVLLEMNRQPNTLGNWIGLPTPIPCRIASINPTRGPQVFHISVLRRPHSQGSEFNRMSISNVGEAAAGVRWRAVPWVIGDPVGGAAAAAFNAILWAYDLLTSFATGLPNPNNQPKFSAGFTCP